MATYPTGSKLSYLRNLDSFEETFGEFVEEIKYSFNEDYGKIEFDGKTLTLITGGWSGNEDILYALQDNIGFWNTYWQKTERGGKFTFYKD